MLLFKKVNERTTYWASNLKEDMAGIMLDVKIKSLYYLSGLHIHNNSTSCSDHELSLRFQKSCSRELSDVLLLKPCTMNN